VLVNVADQASPAGIGGTIIVIFTYLHLDSDIRLRCWEFTIACCSCI